MRIDFILYIISLNQFFIHIAFLLHYTWENFKKFDIPHDDTELKYLFGNNIFIVE